MASQILRLRKQRTRQHVIADLSVHHVEGFILEEGHTAQRLGSDYGYDLFMCTFDERGYAESGLIYFQFKAMETLEESGADFVYDLDIRDYNLWIREESPVILILFDATRRRGFWLPVQRYFREDFARCPKKGAKNVRGACAQATDREPEGYRENARPQVEKAATGAIMKRSKVTYGELDKVLRSLGFSCRPSKNDPPGRIYEHKEAGAMIMLPGFPETDKVFEHHMLAVRTELDNFGIADATVFAAKLNKAG